MFLHSSAACKSYVLDYSNEPKKWNGKITRFLDCSMVEEKLHISIIGNIIDLCELKANIYAMKKIFKKINHIGWPLFV